MKQIRTICSQMLVEDRRETENVVLWLIVWGGSAYLHLIITAHPSNQFLFFYNFEISQFLQKHNTHQ